MSQGRSQEPSEQEAAEERLECVLPSIQAVVGDRFGGLWIESTSPSSLVSVAVVRPTQEDVDRLDELARGVGWMVRVHAVRYSARELEEFADRVTHLMTDGEPDVWLSVGWSPESNRVEAELSRIEPGLLRMIAAAIPEDAVAVRIAPGFGFEALNELPGWERRGRLKNPSGTSP